MSVIDKVELVDAMCREIDELARNGIRMREPSVSPEREHWLMMMRRYGRDLTEKVLGPEPIKTT